MQFDAKMSGLPTFQLTPVALVPQLQNQVFVIIRFVKHIVLLVPIWYQKKCLGAAARGAIARLR